MHGQPIKPGANRVWEHFHHEADVGVRGIGESPAAAFEQAALAMTAVITDPGGVCCQEQVEVDCAAPDLELLLVDWLNALVYAMATRHMLFGGFEVTIEEGRLRGAACGEPLDLARHAPAVEVKGATYTALEVREDAPGQWHAQCVIDV